MHTSIYLVATTGRQYQCVGGVGEYDQGSGYVKYPRGEYVFGGVGGYHMLDPPPGRDLGAEIPL